MATPKFDDPIPEPSCEQITAYHEAGHAVCYEAMGQQLRSVWIRMETGDLRNGQHRSEEWEGLTEPASDNVPSAVFARVVWAGSLTEAKFRVAFGIAVKEKLDAAAVAEELLFETQSVLEEARKVLNASFQDRPRRNSANLWFEFRLRRPNATEPVEQPVFFGNSCVDFNRAQIRIQEEGPLAAETLECLAGSCLDTIRDVDAPVFWRRVVALAEAIIAEPPIEREGFVWKEIPGDRAIAIIRGVGQV